MHSSLKIAAALLLTATAAQAQQGPGWFVPGPSAPQGGGQPGGPTAIRPAQTRPAQPTQQPRPQPPAQITQQPADQAEPPPIQVQLPPLPELPALARGTPPPVAVIGVLGVPDIMRAASAALKVEKTITERREKLNEDAQKEQASWRDMQQALATQRAGLSADQIRAKERELQDRITNSQKQLRDRNRFIQESAQVGLAQIERMLIGVIRQVAESRGMNLVLRREQVALNVNEYDITDAVVEQLNKVLPTVLMPPDGVSPVAYMAPGGPGGIPAAPVATPTAATGAPLSAPASAPAPVPAPAPAPATGPRR